MAGNHRGISFEKLDLVGVAEMHSTEKESDKYAATKAMAVNGAFLAAGLFTIWLQKSGPIYLSYFFRWNCSVRNCPSLLQEKASKTLAHGFYLAP